MVLWVFRRFGPSNRVGRRAGCRTLSFVEIQAQTLEKILMKTLRRQIWSVSGWSHLSQAREPRPRNRGRSANENLRRSPPVRCASSHAHKHQRHKVHTIYNLCIHHVFTQDIDTYSLCLCIIKYIWMHARKVQRHKHVHKACGHKACGHKACDHKSM